MHVRRICQNLACGINLIAHLENADVVAGGRVSMGGLHRRTSCQHVAIPPAEHANMFCSALLYPVTMKTNNKPSAFYQTRPREPGRLSESSACHACN